ncbi:MAG: hypothetical protein ABW328_17180 [Ilumatobacteraceae bacterium]
MNGPLARGVAVVSIDTELAWGDAGRAPTAGGRGYGTEREVIARILDVLVTHRISATWAMVGHLFLDRCAPVGDVVHPEIQRPPSEPDWFAIDPCSTLADAPWYYGADVVAAIAGCPVDQEIACHSFSHVVATECGPEWFASELAACRTLAAARGIDLRSFVYPRNGIAHVDQLRSAGIVAYRGPTASGRRGPAGGLATRIVDRIRPGGRSAVDPQRDPAGVWNLPQTYLLAPSTHGRLLPVPVWSRAPIARLRQAARQRSLFHLWFHPYNVTADPDRAFGALDAVCRAAARLRDAGDLDIMTMGQLAAHLDAV